MLYFYNLGQASNIKREIEERGDTYLTTEDIHRVDIVEATPESVKEWEQDPDSELWPVYDYFKGKSWEPMECKDKEAAYDAVQTAENQKIYEYIHDI